jgi:anaerobic magnesium-protoporphyrin IX monomethyl ester cyclase
LKVLFLVDPFQVEPLGIGYLAASIKKRGHEAELLKINNNGFLHELETYKPDVVAFSVTTGKHGRHLELARKIKEKYRVITVFGGSHPTYFPEVVHQQGVDVVIRGEAEKSFGEMLDDITMHKRVRSVIECRVLEQNIDRIPFPDREFLYKYPENRNNPIKNVMTSRGCRFSCPYCFNSIYRELYHGQNWVRYRSPENVIAECVGLKKYPLKLIFFQDDEFLSNPNLDALLDSYRDKVGVPFHCQIRIEFLTEDKAAMLWRAGCTGVTFAIECGNEYLRKDVLKRNISDSQILSGARLLRKYGLKFRTENMVGIPGENISQMIETVELNAKCRPTIGWASIFQPYPRLPLTNYALLNGFWDGKGPFRDSFFEDSVLTTSVRKEIVNIQRLFGVAVGNSAVRKVLPGLIRMPNNKFYDTISRKWKGSHYGKLFS